MVSGRVDFGLSWRSANDKIFGREEESRQIDKILLNLAKSNGTTSSNNDKDDSTSTSSSALLEIRGMAGSGKSSLIRHYPFKQKGWLLCCGKFDVNKTVEPYSAVIEALDRLIEQWVLEEEREQQQQELQFIQEEDDEEETEEGKKDNDNNSSKPITQNLQKFRDLLNNEATRDILKNVLPRALVVGGVLSQRESKVDPRTRKSLSFCTDGVGERFICPDAFQAAVHQMISFLCSTRRVVLFLDDIQWADEASLRILKSLVKSTDLVDPNQGDGEGGLLVAVSYRAEEVDESHTVASWLKDIKDSLVTTETVHIKNLQIESLNALVAHLVGHEPDETLPLTQVIHQKTAGNPFFVLQLLTLLRYEHFLRYNFIKFKWEWGQVDKIQALANISDNVADVVAATIQRLPIETQVVLQVASCLGRKVVPVGVLRAYFDFVRSMQHLRSNDDISLEILEILAKEDGMDTALDTAVANGILVDCENNSNRKWSHDKLLQFSYDMIPPKLRPSWHLRLGKLLWARSNTAMGRDWMVFSAADQMNRFYDLNTGEDSSEEESTNKVDVARLNLEAAKLSMNKAALFPAMDMLRSASQYLLEHNEGKTWDEENYELSLEIFSRLAQIGVKIGQHEDAMKAVEHVEANAKSIDDKHRVHCAMLTVTTSGNNRDYELGVKKSLEILRLYGQKLPKRFFRYHLYFEKLTLQRHLPGGNLEGLLKLPATDDARAAKVTKLLIQYVSFCASFSEKYKGLRTLCTLRSLNIACRHGLNESTADSILYYAADLKRGGQYKEALKYAKLAIGLVDKFPRRVGSNQCRLRVQATVGIFGAVIPQGTNLETLLEAHKIGLKIGDTEHTIIALMAYCWEYMCMGLPIGPLKSDLERYLKEAETLKAVSSVIVQFKIWLQTILNLQLIEPGEEDEGKCKRTPAAILIGKAMNQEDELKKLDGGGVKMTSRDVNSARLMLACIYNDLDTAQEMVDALEEYLKFDIFVSRVYFRNGYLGLAAFALSRKGEVQKNKQRYRKLGEKALKYFQKETSLGSINALPILTILQAEKSPSKEGYEKAIRTCARLGFSQHEAYMSERAGEYFLNVVNDEEWGKMYFDRALSLYKDWGATGKVNAIMTGPYMHILTPATQARKNHNTALKGRRRFTKGHSKLLKSMQGAVSFRGSSLFGSGSSNGGTRGFMDTRAL